jgi:threonine dehydrogenase-like Zn-dependent dehydrogenase
MKAITQTAPHTLEWLDLPLPGPGAGEVRIRTLACGICATDLLMIAGWERTGFPSIPGHEWCGRVDAVGEGADPALVGKLVVGDNILPDGREVGFESPGGYAQFFVTRAGALFPLPDAIPPEVATLTEPMAVCLRAASRLPASLQEAFIFGDGPIGLLTLMLLKQRGIRGLGMAGGKPAHLALARELGAEQTFDFHTLPDLAGTLRSELAYLPPCIIDASGSATALNTAIDLVAPHGQILIVGDYGDARAGFHWNDLLLREIAIAGSNTGTGAWGTAVAFLKEGKLPFKRLISHVIPAHEFEQAIATARAGADQTIKVILRWPD